MADLIVYLIPAGVMGGLGLALSGALLIAAKKFYVYEDPNIDLVENMLPGANCGGCGLSGCRKFAEAIVAGEEDLNCPVGADGMMEQIAVALGLELASQQPMVAHVMCEGLQSSAQFNGEYHGIHDCRAAHLVGQSDRSCKYGCIGLGTCVQACEFDAIEIYDGIAHIIPENCVACGKCVPACPRGIIEMIPKGRQVFVPCKSFDLGKRVTQVCEIGCIGCRKCEKACNYDAIGFDDNLAWVKWDNCVKCLDCVVACPRDLIKVRDMKLYIVEPEDLKVGLDDKGRKTVEAKQRRAEKLAAQQAEEEAKAAAGGEEAQ